MGDGMDDKEIPVRKPYEEHAAEKQTAPWLVAAASSMRGWAVGREVTEAEFDKAISAAGAVRIG